MHLYSIHERPAKNGGSDVIAVASGFSWLAALLPLVWFLWHRLWLGLVVYFILASLLGMALELAGIAEPAGMVIAVAVNFLIGAMAADYRRWTYARHGWVMRDIVLADSAWDAEQRYIISRRRSPAATPPAVPPAPAMPPPMMAPRGSDVFPRLV